MYYIRSMHLMKVFLTCVEIQAEETLFSVIKVEIFVNFSLLDACCLPSLAFDGLSPPCCSREWA